MQTRLSVCNQGLFLTLEKGLSRKLQTLPWYPSARPAMWVLTLIFYPKTPLTPRPPLGQCLLRSVPITKANRNPTSLWKDGPHNITPGLAAAFLGSSPTH